MNVFFAGGGTGGHLYPALAIARAMVRADSRVTPFFIGARRGIEREILPTTEFEFELLDLHPLYRTRPWQNLRTVGGGLTAWRRIASLVQARQARALVATGGYAAGVALGVASRRGVPIIIQEQNSYPGLTVRWFARRAAQIHIGFPEAAAHLRLGRQTRLFTSGNPIEPPPPPAERVNREIAAASWGFDLDGRTTVLVFGGSQGAQGVNRAVAEWIRLGGPDHEPQTRVIWATGPANFDQYASLEGPTVKVRPYIAPMRDAYAAADLAISRSGAMTTAELAAWGIPALLVPLPTAAADHQTANARAIAKAGAGVLLQQHGLDATMLASALARVLREPGALALMRERTLERARPDAAQNIATHILDTRYFK